jgi:pantothenate kinase
LRELAARSAAALLAQLLGDAAHLNRHRVLARRSRQLRGRRRRLQAATALGGLQSRPCPQPLQRLRRREADVVYAPEFRRETEDAITGAMPIPASAAIVVTEGNYLLLDTGDWGRVRSRLDEAWYVEVDEEMRVRSLIQRHIDYGKSPAEARAGVMRSDQRNAEIIAATRSNADVIVRIRWSAEAKR